MTSTGTEPTAATTEEGIQQIPTTSVRVTQPAAVTDARDQLLRAIGQEAQHVADSNPGQAPTALEALARAYALLTVNAGAGGITPADHARIPSAMSRSGGLDLSSEFATDGSATGELNYL
ncbi:hypothetical protein [Streptomyces cyaneofuscatus]|uniref:hypothetical protein n=1 Tax=Streptomyces cyaneofuscatus TaxID=66883 RepID=UPI0037ADD96F